MSSGWATTEPARAEIDSMTGPVLVEFGSPNCGHCRRAQPLVAEALGAYTQIRHLKVADGPGQPLGRSFGVRLWPTLVFLRDGHEVARLVRPERVAPIRDAAALVSAPA